MAVGENGTQPLDGEGREAEVGTVGRNSVPVGASGRGEETPTFERLMEVARKAGKVGILSKRHPSNTGTSEAVGPVEGHREGGLQAESQIGLADGPVPERRTSVVCGDGEGSLGSVSVTRMAVVRDKIGEVGGVLGAGVGLEGVVALPGGLNVNGGDGVFSVVDGPLVEVEVGASGNGLHQMGAIDAVGVAAAEGVGSQDALFDGLDDGWDGLSDSDVAMAVPVVRVRRGGPSVVTTFRGDLARILFVCPGDDCGRGGVNEGGTVRAGASLPAGWVKVKLNMLGQMEGVERLVAALKKLGSADYIVKVSMGGGEVEFWMWEWMTLPVLWLMEGKKVDFIGQRECDRAFVSLGKSQDLPEGLRGYGLVFLANWAAPSVVWADWVEGVLAFVAGGGVVYPPCAGRLGRDSMIEDKHYSVAAAVWEAGGWLPEAPEIHLFATAVKCLKNGAVVGRKGAFGLSTLWWRGDEDLLDLRRSWEADRDVKLKTGLDAARYFASARNHLLNYFGVVVVNFVGGDVGEVVHVRPTVFGRETERVKRARKLSDVPILASLVDLVALGDDYFDGEWINPPGVTETEGLDAMKDFARKVYDEMVLNEAWLGGVSDVQTAYGVVGAIHVGLVQRGRELFYTVVRVESMPQRLFLDSESGFTFANGMAEALRRGGYLA
ncbi:hypothetical protein CYLTODRAFT_459265 [Cylindrobasidium torrendii FP15055 ss-10]|uniref:Uncharacterized protein n=1 Tax=Cylindrobasidium torrendii FP15055 ss-10 TaxID=1314674 RepID=A0A0D7AW82_9AGAR|nr:hypothetical protein CYLTODRAFT_459265 [Cylindrobasidium torrendii FP15055 ss-10]